MQSKDNLMVNLFSCQYVLHCVKINDLSKLQQNNY